MSEHLPSERPSAEPAGHADPRGEDAEGALEAALDVLREPGGRSTAPRLAVLRVLAVEHALPCRGRLPGQPARVGLRGHLRHVRGNAMP